MYFRFRLPPVSATFSQNNRLSVQAQPDGQLFGLTVVDEVLAVVVEVLAGGGVVVEVVMVVGAVDVVVGVDVDSSSSWATIAAANKQVPTASSRATLLIESVMTCVRKDVKASWLRK